MCRREQMCETREEIWRWLPIKTTVTDVIMQSLKISFYQKHNRNYVNDALYERNRGLHK